MRLIFRIAGLLAGLAALAGCAEGELAIERPGDRSYVPAGDVTVEARGDARRVAVAVDGIPVAELPRDVDGRFRGTVTVARGAHDIAVYDPDAAGVVARARVFADRLPDAPVDGWGFAPDAEWMLTLADTSPADDGLAVGRLALVRIGGDGGTARVLSEDGAFGEIDAAVPRHVAWVEGWEGGAGTLHLDRVTGGAERAWPDVREIRFSDGILAARDEGLFLAGENVGGEVYEKRIASYSDAFAWLGADLVTFGEGRATIARAPDHDTTVLAPPVETVLARSTRREVAFRTADFGALLVHDIATGATQAGPARTEGFEFSADGAWIVAIAEGALAYAPRPGAFTQVAGQFLAAAFARDGEHLYALEESGALVEVDLASGAVTLLATDARSFGTLAEGAVAWYDDANVLVLRRADGAVVPLGSLSAVRPEIAVRADGARLAFTTPEGPIRTVEVATGATADLGTEARRPSFLEGAIAWLELREDAEDGGLANHDLWLLPAFPASIRGPLRVAERVTDAPLPRSFDGRTLATLADLPRRGERWEGRVACADVQGDVGDLGPADGALRVVFFLPDGRIAHFGPEGSEERVLWLERCGMSVSQGP